MTPIRSTCFFVKFLLRPGRLALAIFGLLSVLMLNGCGASAASSRDSGYPVLYGQKTRALSNGDSAQQEKLREKFAEFISFYASLKTDDVAMQVRNIYSENLYFSDTLKTFSDRDRLVAYLEETADRIEYNHVDITSIIPFGDDYFMRWKMSSGFKVFGRMIAAESIGMTHIRLDKDGKVNFHQDFWDNTEGLFQHLPVVGFVVRKTRDRL